LGYVFGIGIVIGTDDWPFLNSVMAHNFGTQMFRYMRTKFHMNTWLELAQIKCCWEKSVKYIGILATKIIPQTSEPHVQSLDPVGPVWLINVQNISIHPHRIYFSVAMLWYAFW